LISHVDQALGVADAIVAVEPVAIALTRKRLPRVSLAQSLVQVMLGGAIVAGVEFAPGQA